MRFTELRVMQSHPLSWLPLLLVGLLLVQCSGRTPRPVPDPRTGFHEGMRHYENEKWSQARLAFETIVFNHPGSSIVDSAQYMMAMSYYREGDPILAAAEFQRVRAQYPTSPLVDDAAYMRALNLLEAAPSHTGLDQEKTQEAVNELLLFKDSYPLSEFVPRADSLLSVAYGRLSVKDFKTGVLYQKLNQYEAAEIYFQGMIDRYPESPLVPEALFRMGEGQEKRDSLGNALEYYEKVVYLYPDHERAGDARKRIARIARQREDAPAAEVDADTATEHR
jgi:outer membrane protein assembly factor BamD